MSKFLRHGLPLMGKFPVKIRILGNVGVALSRIEKVQFASDINLARLEMLVPNGCNDFRS